MAVLRYLMFLSLVIWIGGIIFFAFVVTRTAFAVLPTHHLAGNIVNRSLASLHWMGVVSGVAFLISSLIFSYLKTGTISPLTWRNFLVCVMLLLTLVSQFVISPRMSALRAAMGDIDSVSASDPARVEFNSLHGWSTRLEGAVLLMGLAALYFTTALA